MTYKRKGSIGLQDPRKEGIMGKTREALKEAEIRQNAAAVSECTAPDRQLFFDLLAEALNKHSEIPHRTLRISQLWSQ